MKNQINKGDRFEIVGNKSFHDFVIGSVVEVVDIITTRDQYRTISPGKPWYECKLVDGEFRIFTQYNSNKQNPESFCIINDTTDFK